MSTTTKFEPGAIVTVPTSAVRPPVHAVALVGQCYRSERGRIGKVLAVFRDSLGELQALVCEPGLSHLSHDVWPLEIAAKLCGEAPDGLAAAFELAVAMAAKGRAKSKAKKKAEADAFEWGLVVGDYAITRATKTLLAGYRRKGHRVLVCRWSRFGGWERGSNGRLPDEVQDAVREFVGDRDRVDIVAERKRGGQ